MKVIVIAGPTASGKTDLSIRLALYLKKAEIISADSRQVYKGMNIGTGKITKKETKGIPHHLIDIASPKKRFTVFQYQKKGKKIIDQIIKKNKIPIIVGGTGFYINSLTKGLSFPQVLPDTKLRKSLEKEKNLFELLKKLDPERAKSIDKHNKRRLIRAIEIVLKTKKPVPGLKEQTQPYQVLFLGIKKEKKELKKLIEKRLLKRLNQGMIKEVKGLGLSWKRLEEFGLEYKYIAQYLQKKITYQEMIDILLKEIEKYTKRQMTWFKKEKNIIWVKNWQETKKIVKEFV